MLKQNPGRVTTGIILLIVIFQFGGCAGWRPAHQPETVVTPEKFINAGLLSDFSDGPWWRDLGDNQLDSLMNEVFTNNLTLEQAIARLDQSRASLVSSRSGWFPWITANGSITETGEIDQGNNTPQVAPQPRYGANLTASYELDVWGKIAAGSSAAKANFLASEEDLRAVLFSVSAQFARNYYLVAELRQQRDLLEKTARSYHDSYDLVLSRYHRGLVTSQDVYQARTTLAGAEAQKASVASSLKSAEYGLAVLLNQYPREGILTSQTIIPETVPIVTTGLPSQLVNRRPDVKSAYYRLISADKSAAEAVAARLPSFSLTGTIYSSSDDAEDLVDPEKMLWNAIGNLALPVFQGGRLKANADRAKAVWQESLAGYQATVLNAYKEVEDALSSMTLLQEYVDQLEQQVAAASSTLRLAKENYLRGVVDYLSVVTAQTTYFNAQQSLISARRNLIDVYINLAVSLGGGWTDDIIEQKLLTEN